MPRRGFNHPLSRIVPHQRWTDERILELYHLLRANRDFRDEMFMAHLRLGFAKVAFFAMRDSSRTEELVSVMVTSLWEGIQRLIDGAIVHHEKPNPTGYLMLKLRGDLQRFCFEDRVIPSYAGQKKFAKRRIPLDEDSVETVDFVSSLVAQEITVKACWSDRDNEILSRSLAGETDTEIGQALQISKARVGQIKKDMASRIKDYL